MGTLNQWIEDKWEKFFGLCVDPPMWTWEELKAAALDGKDWTKT